MIHIIQHRVHYNTVQSLLVLFSTMCNHSSRPNLYFLLYISLRKNVAKAKVCLDSRITRGDLICTFLLNKVESTINILKLLKLSSSSSVCLSFPPLVSHDFFQNLPCKHKQGNLQQKKFSNLKKMREEYCLRIEKYSKKVYHMMNECNFFSNFASAS